MKYITRVLKVKYPKAAFLTKDELAKATMAIKRASASCREVKTFKYKTKTRWSYDIIKDKMNIPHVECIESVYVAMHECGHFNRQHGIMVAKDEFGLFDKQIKDEEEANAFALKLFKTTTTNLKAIAIFEKMIAKQIELRVNTLNWNGPAPRQRYFKYPKLVGFVIKVFLPLARRGAEAKRIELKNKRLEKLKTKKEV